MREHHRDRLGRITSACRSRRRSRGLTSSRRSMGVTWVSVGAPSLGESAKEEADESSCIRGVALALSGSKEAGAGSSAGPPSCAGGRYEVAAVFPGSREMVPPPSSVQSAGASGGARSSVLVWWLEGAV